MFFKFLKKIIFPIIRAIWVERVEGLENIPDEGGLIIASNHQSYFDFICFSAVSPRRVYYLAGEVFFRKWWWRPIVKFTGQIRVDRHHKDKGVAMNQALNILKRGEVLGIFPEGTRSSNGKLQKAYTGVSKLALMSYAPIIPIGMIGTFEIMSRHEKFPHLKKCRIKIGRPIHLDQYYNNQNSQLVLRKITDEIVMKKISGLLYKKYNNEQL